MLLTGANAGNYSAARSGTRSANSNAPSSPQARLMGIRGNNAVRLVAERFDLDFGTAVARRIYVPGITVRSQGRNCTARIAKRDLVFAVNGSSVLLMKTQNVTLNLA